MEIKLSYLRGLSEYQWELIRKIEGLRGQDWTYKEIADYLHSDEKQLPWGVGIFHRPQIYLL